MREIEKKAEREENGEKQQGERREIPHTFSVIWRTFSWIALSLSSSSSAICSSSACWSLRHCNNSCRSTWTFFDWAMRGKTASLGKGEMSGVLVAEGKCFSVYINHVRISSLPISPVLLCRERRSRLPKRSQIRRKRATPMQKRRLLLLQAAEHRLCVRMRVCVRERER